MHLCYKSESVNSNQYRDSLADREDYSLAREEFRNSEYGKDSISEI